MMSIRTIYLDQCNKHDKIILLMHWPHWGEISFLVSFFLAVFCNFSARTKWQKLAKFAPNLENFVSQYFKWSKLCLVFLHPKRLCICGENIWDKFCHLCWNYWRNIRLLRHWPHLQPMQATLLLTASHRILSSVARLWKSGWFRPGDWKSMKDWPILRTMI